MAYGHANTPESHEKRERNRRVAARYDELMAEGKHGHYETMFRVVREEVERALETEITYNSPAHSSRSNSETKP